MLVLLVVRQKRRGRATVRTVRARERLLARVSPHVFRESSFPLQRLVAHLARELCESLMNEAVPLQGGGAGKVLLADGALERAGGVDGAHVVFLLAVGVKHHVTLSALQACPVPRTSHLLAFGQI